MTTLLVTHPACLLHETPRGHPERLDRVVAVEAALATPRFSALVRADAPRAAIETISLCHPIDYIENLRRQTPHDDEGLVAIDADTTMSPGTWESALRAAGGAVFAIDQVIARVVQNAFVATRPPGHHAEPKRAMGFCFFNNAAIAARHAQRIHGLERIAIVDFDVHHGNGTQAIFWSDSSVLYASTHQMPLYPGTGAALETGEAGTIVNAPLSPGAGSLEFRQAMNECILPKLEDFAPDLIVVSAGFDAHRRDPLGGLDLDEDDFAWITERLMAAADRSASGRLVSVLEGGYDLEALAASTAAHVSTLMQRS